MGFKFNEGKNCWEAFSSKRHPITRQTVSLRRTGLKSEAEAKRAERELIVKVNAKCHSAIVPNWNLVVQGYLQSCIDADFSGTTLANMIANLNAATGKWNDRAVDSISADEVRQVIKVDYGEKSVHQQRNIYKVIKGTFRFAMENGYINRIPVPQMKFRPGDKIKKVLTVAQVRRLLQKSKELNWPWYYHYAVALYCGLRNGELFALTWDKVDFNHRQILVNQSWNKVDGNKETKSGDDRIVEIAPNLLTVLMELKLITGSTAFVLPRNRHWDRGDQARELRRFLEGIGLPAVRFHDLRATWATIMLSSGIPPIKVMVMGGWKDLKTMQIYIRKAGVDIKGITDELDLHDPCLAEGKVLIFEKRD